MVTDSISYAKPTITLEDKLNARLAFLQSHKSKSTSLSDEQSRAWIAKNLSMIGIPAKFLDICVEILEYMGDTRLVWLHLQECTGCSESLLRTEEPGFDVLLFDIFKLHYHDLVLAPSGHHAHKTLKDLESTPYVLLVEGSVSMGAEEEYITLGGVSGYEEAKHLIQGAQAVFAVGTCSSYGGIQTAYPNPTNSFSLQEAFATLEKRAEIIHIPGCPPSDKNIIGNLLYVYVLGENPPLDELNRPLWAYAKSVHDLCERRNFFLSGDFVQGFDDPNMEQGYCLYKVGCKGPYTFNNCPKVKFNAKTSWPVQAGHGCIGCSEPNFWDNFGLIEKPLSNKDAASFTPRFLPQRAIQATFRDKPISKEEFLALSQALHAEYKNTCDTSCNHTTKDASSERQTNTTKPPIALLLDMDKGFVCISTPNANSRYEFSEWESNPAALITALESKSKQTKRLSYNYAQMFAAQYDRIMKNDAVPLPSRSINALLQVFFALIQPESNTLENLIQSAESFAYPHKSPLGFKWKKSSVQGNSQTDTANSHIVDCGRLEVDSTKALSNMLAYYIGGLDVAGVSFSLMSDMGESLGEILAKLAAESAQELESYTLHFYAQGTLCHSHIFTQALLRVLPPKSPITIAK